MRKLTIIEKTFLYKILVIYKIIHLAHIKDAPKDYYPFIIQLLLLSRVTKILHAFLEVWEVSCYWTPFSVKNVLREFYNFICVCLRILKFRFWIFLFSGFQLYCLKERISIKSVLVKKTSLQAILKITLFK